MSLEQTLKLPIPDGLNTACLSDSKRYFASSGYDGNVVLVDLTNREVVCQFETEVGMGTICIDEPRQRIHTISQRGKVHSFDFEKRRSLGNQPTGFDPPSAGVFLPQSRRWIGGGVTGKIWLLDPGPDLPLSINKYKNDVIHTGAVNVITATPDGQRCLTACSDGTTLLRDTETLEVILNFDELDSPVTAAAFNSDGTTLITGQQNGGITFWNTKQ